METERLEIIKVDNIIYFDFKNNKIPPRNRFKTKGELRQERVIRERDKKNKQITEETKPTKQGEKK